MAKTRRQREQSNNQRASAREWADKRQSEFANNCVKLPDGIEWFDYQNGKSQALDFMSYICGEGNPHCDPGRPYFQRTYYRHRNLGPSGKAVAVCPARTFHKPCPICEYRDSIRGDGNDKELIKKLYTQERQLWLPRSVGVKGDGKVRLWDVSHHCFGKSLLAFIQDNEDEEGYWEFADYANGFTVKLGFSKESIGEGGSPYWDVSSILFKERSKQYTQKDVQSMPCLDDLLIEMSYKQLKALLFAEELDNDATSAGSRKSSAKGKKQEDDDDDWDADESEDDDEDDDEPPKKSSKSKSVSKKKTDFDFDDWDVDDEDDDEEEEAPENACAACGGSGKNSKGGKCRPCNGSGSIDDDDDEEEDDDKPTPASRSRSAKPAARTKAAKAKPSSTKGKKQADDDDDWDVDDDDEDDDEEEEEETKPARGGRTRSAAKASTAKAKPKRGKAADDDDEDDWD